ncbi:hypothetical protein EMCRGX_G031470 [Ephydatia muelleri]
MKPWWCLAQQLSCYYLKWENNTASSSFSICAYLVSALVIERDAYATGFLSWSRTNASTGAAESPSVTFLKASFCSHSKVWYEFRYIVQYAQQSLNSPFILGWRHPTNCPNSFSIWCNPLSIYYVSQTFRRQ